jgi:hypothetical protein
MPKNFTAGNSGVQSGIGGALDRDIEGQSGAGGNWRQTIRHWKSF